MRRRAPPPWDGGARQDLRGEWTGLGAVAGLLGGLPLLPLLRPLLPGLLHLRPLFLHERLGEGLPLQLLRAELLHDPGDRLAHRLLALRVAPASRSVAPAARHVGAALLHLRLDEL